MACNTYSLKNEIKFCSDATLIAGYKAVYLMNHENIDKTATQTGIDAVGNINKLIIPKIELVNESMLDSESGFITIQQAKGVATGASQSAKTNRTVVKTQTTTFVVYSDALQTSECNMLAFIQALENQKFVAVLERNDGTADVLGYDNGLEVTASPYNGGVGATDLTGYTFTLVGDAELNPIRIIKDLTTFKTSAVVGVI
jgi:hypothetical protein